MAGDVRGTFDLNDRPATEAMRRLQRQGEELDATLVALGKTVDEVFTTDNIAEVKAYEEALSRVESQGRTTFGSLSRNAKEAEYSVVSSIRQMDSSVVLFRENLDDLSHSRATPKVDLDGVTEALAQVELLEERLSSLGRRTANPRVGVPSSTVARDAFTADRTVSRVASTASSGGGGSSFLHGGLQIPFAGSIPWPLVGGALAAAPPLLGAATAVGGSLGGAALGAGSLALGAYGTGAAAVGLTAPVAISSIAGIKEASKALASYQKEVIKSGVNSEAARQKFRLYNMELEKAPAGTRRLLRAKTGLVEGFKQQTKPAQGGFTGILTRGLNLGRQLTPLYAEQANQFFGAAQPEANQYANFLNSGSARQFYTSMGGEATKSLRPAENVLENATSTLMSLSRAARPFFTEGLDFLSRWTGEWRKNAHDISGIREDMRGWETDLQSWGKLGGGAFDLIRDLGKSSEGSGTSLVDDLTAQLHQWDDWINRNPRKVESFFSESVSSTEKIAGALGNITSFLFEIGKLLTPLLTQIAQLTRFASSTGLLSGPGLPLLLAGGAGVRNAIGGARGRILGTAGGAAGEEVALAAGGGLLAGGGARAATGGVFSRAGSYLGGLRGSYAAAGRVPVMEAGAAGGLTMGMEADAGMLGETTFSRTAALRGLGRSALPDALGIGGDFIRGAGARFLPIAALMGGLGAISSGQSFGSRAWFQGALSGASAGLIPAPKTTPEKEDEATRHAQMVSDYYGERYGGGLKGQREQILALRRKRHRLLTPSGTGGGFDPHFEGASSVGDFISHGVGFRTRGSSVTTESRDEAEALMKQIEQLQGSNKQVGGERGAELGGQFQGAFNVRRAHEGGVAALGDVAPEVLQKIRNLKTQGGQVLAESVLEWTRVAKQHNPKLKAEYEELVEGITREFAGMGHHIKVINGEIFEGSAREWQAIEKAMVNPTEKAKEQVDANFTAIQKEAMNVLRAMGYSPSDAHHLVQQAESSGQGGNAARQAERKGPNSYVSGIALEGKAGPVPTGQTKRGNFSGGRIPQPADGSMHDDVQIGANEWAAGGELMINRHTERAANQILSHAGKTLGGLVAQEQRGHSQGFARGGRRGGGFGGGSVTLDSGVNMNVGEEPRILSDLRRLSAELHERVYVISGYRSPAHSVSVGGFADDPHTRGEAADIGVGSPSLASMFGVSEAQLKAVGLYRPFYPASAAEVNHVQLVAGGASGALRNGGIHSAGGLGGRGGRAVPPVHLRGRQSGLGGVPGAMSDQASALMAGGLGKRLTELTQKHPPGGRGGTGGVSGPLAHGGVERQIYQELRRGGFNRTGAAGVIGNAYAESSLVPTATDGAGNGGLWGFTASPNSLSDLQSYAGSVHGSWGNAALQTRFLLQHLNHGLVGQVNAAASPELAARIFMEQFERPGIPRLDVREQGARTAFDHGFSRGGRVSHGFAGWFKDGFHGRVSGPTLMGVGEAGAEDVHITPTSRQGRAGRGRGRDIKVEVNLGNVHVSSSKDARKLAEEIGRQAAEKLAEALEEGDEVGDEELINA